jgi:nicotinamide-nucleotide adenylyltransferase
MFQLIPDRSNAHAVWDGRFQPLHRGHIKVMEAIVEQFDCDLVVMIIQSSEGFVDSYSQEVNRHHRHARNPLTFWERYQLIRLALNPLSIASRVTILGIPRPDLYWEIARSFYPACRFICLTDKDDYEKSKATFWSQLGETTRIVDTSKIPRISATDVKHSLKSGHGWEKYMPEASVEYFKNIDGPARFQRADL